MRQNSTRYFTMKTSNKGELQYIAFNHSTDIQFKDFTNFYKKHNAKLYSVLMIDSTLASDSHLHFRKSLLDGI